MKEGVCESSFDADLEEDGLGPLVVVSTLVLCEDLDAFNE